MVRSCLVCTQCVYVDKINSMILSGKKITEVLEWLKDKDSRITYRMLYNHSKNHLPKKKTKDLREKAIQEQLSITLSTLQTLTNNMEIVNKRIQDKISGDLDIKEETLLLRLISESRQITSEVRNWIKQLEYEPIDVELVDSKVMYSILHFRLNLKKEFLSRWESLSGLSMKEIDDKIKEERNKDV